MHPAHVRVEAFPPETVVGLSDRTVWAIDLDGFIDADAAPRLAEVIARRHVSRATVYFNSPGGSLVAGMTLKRLLRKHGYATDVGRRSTAPPARPGPGRLLQRLPVRLRGRRVAAPRLRIGARRASSGQPGACSN